VTTVRHRLTILNRTTTLHPIRSRLLHRRRRLSNSSNSNSNSSTRRPTTLSSSNISSNNTSSNITNSNSNRNSTTLDLRRRQALP
jgi:hypothetical protein